MPVLYADSAFSLAMHLRVPWGFATKHLFQHLTGRRIRCHIQSSALNVISCGQLLPQTVLACETKASNYFHGQRH